MNSNITYRFSTPVYPGNILYVNMVSNYSCTNECTFCSRPKNKKDFGKETIYEQKARTSLYLKKSPSIIELKKEIQKNIKKDDKELAIIGLGEPLLYLPKVLQVIKFVKTKYNIKTRVDTNGLANCTNKNLAKSLKTAGLDEIRISLNAINEQNYNKLCKPKYKNAFPKLIEFVKACINEKIDTHVSFVINYQNKKLNIDTSNKNDFIKFAKSLGIKKENIILREYIPAI